MRRTAPAFLPGDFQNAGGIGEGSDSLPEIDAVFDEVGLPLGFIPFKFHYITI